MLTLAFAVLAALIPISQAPDQGAEIAFVHVNVLPMTSEVLWRDQTVLIRQGRIWSVGAAADTELAEGTRVIDGAGRFLMPGLVDMHVHNWNEAEHTLFLANGVTSVRNMFGSPQHLLWRAQIASGERLGPTIYSAGPIVDGNPPIWPGSRIAVTWEDGEAVVAEHLQAKYDFIKVYSRLPREAYDAIIAAASEARIPVMGHVPNAVGIVDVLAAGQRSIEHLDMYDTLLSPREQAPRSRNVMEAWSALDASRLQSAVQASVEAGVWNCPTLVVMQKFLPSAEIEAEFERPQMRYVSSETRAIWRGMAQNRAAFAAASRLGDPARMRLTYALWKGGARLILGTDQGNPFVVAGFSVHEELHNLVQAGLSNFAALQAATRNGAECLAALNEFGSIAPGLRADLLLLEANPLEDVAHAQGRVGVMVRGVWLPEAELQRSLEALVE